VMEFYDITNEAKAYPGEYLLYKPKMEIVVCGAYLPAKDQIRALMRGSLIEDKIHNFQKIKLNKKERKDRASTRCKGCSGR
jgi:hypothetical protein